MLTAWHTSPAHQIQGQQQEWQDPVEVKLIQCLLLVLLNSKSNLEELTN